MDLESTETPTGTKRLKSQEALKVWVQIIQNLREKENAKSTSVGARTLDTWELGYLEPQIFFPWV